MLGELLGSSGVWGVLLTLAAYGAGVLINRKTGKALFNPLLLGSIFVIVFLSIGGIAYPQYRASAEPLSFLLLPATVSLAIPLYERWELLRKHFAAIMAGIAAGVLTSMLCILLIAAVTGLDRAGYITLLPKSVTTAISMDISAEFGGIVSLTSAVVVLTGIVGNLLAEATCKLFRVTDPVAKGIGIGCAAHAIGTGKALEMGQTEGAMSGLAIAVAGVLTALLCPLFAGLIV